MASSNTLLSLFLMMMLANIVHSHVPDVTSFNIVSFNPTSDGLTYERDASVPSGSSYLRLIPAADASGNPRISSVGRVLYPNAVTLWDDEERDASFETTITLRVTPINNNPADGMTFFIVPVNSTRPTGGEGGNLGIYNAVVPGTPIFTVQFDTFVNSGEDPNYRHIGIDINSRVSKNTTSFENMIGGNVTARITYDATTGSITVVATTPGQDNATVSYVYDLKSILPQHVQVGLSASTGPTNVAFFDVFAWKFTSKMVPDDVTSFQYDSFNPTSDGLTYERDASVPSGSSYLRLIPADDASGNPRKSSVGRVLYSNAVTLWDDEERDASFETTITLRVTPINNNPADGMTFFIVPVNSTRPTNGEGGNLGIYNAVVPGTQIFTVQFDTFVNPGEDPDYRHIGIDINSRVSKNTTSFENMIGGNVTARITYDATTGSITVVATTPGQDNATVSYVYDLKSFLPQQVQVGLSASTGPTNVAFFDVFAWKFTSKMVAVNNAFVAAI